MLFRCSIFFVLCCLCPQWVNGTHGFVEPRPRRSYHHSSECFPEATHGMSSWNTSGGEFHGCYPHQVPMISMIYWWYIDDIPMFHWWNLIRSGEKLQISTYLDWFLQMSEMETSISRISTAREEKHRSPPRPVWNSVVKPGLKHFPHEFVWKITVKTCKNPNLMVYYSFPPIDCYLEVSPISRQLNGWWFMNCFTMFHMFHGGSLI